MTPTPAVEFVGVHKAFGEFHAAEDLHFKIAEGCIHAIVGENGAGKSTSMKLLFGFYRPDKGHIKVRGAVAKFQSPADAMTCGIGMVHQHFMLAETHSALDNILLFEKNTSAFQKLNRKEHKERLQNLAAEYQFHIDWDSPIGQLSVGTQQRIELLKILSQNSKIIILDEPTAVLTPLEIVDLFRNLQKLKKEGRTIIIITHKLKEVMNNADSVTVLRGGRVVANSSIHQTSIEQLAEHMVGRKLKNLDSHPRLKVSDQKSILKISRLNVQNKFSALKNLSLELKSGEILGIAGVEGNGQDELIQSLLSPRSLKLKGQIEINSISSVRLSTARIRSLGFSAFPEDRLRYGVLTSRPAYENFILGYQRSREYSQFGFLRFKNIFKKTAAAMESFDIRPRQIEKSVGSMSGGNQQKLVVARELQTNPQIILAAKPTRGVDIGAVEFIHEQLLNSRNSGAAVLLVSSELEELMTLADRILVLFKGQLVAEFDRKNGYNEIAIGSAMGGHT
ncbi:MAG: ABC transporter ATP-binding protein [Bdellovibrionaceae bacterium]|nr:ABC transporter ATP-binding protein [Pseudobdellovibrionaceae bacterium]